MSTPTIAVPIAVLLAFGIGSTHAAAQEGEESALDTARSFVVTELVARYAFEADGSGTRTFRVRVLVKDRGGVAQWGVVSVPYIASLEQVALNALTVVKPDGSRVSAADAPLDDVRLTGQFDEPVFTDLRAKRVVVPSLQPGDRLEYEFAVRATGSLIPGHFWADHSFFRLGVVEKEVFEVEVPESRNVTTVSRRGVELPPERSAPGRILRRWTHAQAAPDAALLDPKHRQRTILKEAKLGPDVRLSSFQNWEELGRALGRVIGEKAAPDEAVRERARELTKAATTPDERLRVLFAHVSEQVRYVGLAFGTGRLEPRPAGTVLASQYGDCKDKHVLLASLAETIGIEIVPVLVSSVADRPRGTGALPGAVRSPHQRRAPGREPGRLAVAGFDDRRPAAGCVAVAVPGQARTARLRGRRSGDSRAGHRGDACPSADAEPVER